MATAGRDSRTQARAAPPWLREADGAVELALHVQPGARQSRVVGTHGDRLKVAVAAPATEGRANEALLTLLADAAGIPRRSLTLLSGAAARDKRVRLEGLSAAELRTRLGA